MPVADHPIHASVQHDKPPAGCYDRAYITTTMSTLCRQIGQRTPDGWQPLPECVGCIAAKDASYVQQARQDIDQERARYMRADQRIA